MTTRERSFQPRRPSYLSQRLLDRLVVENLDSADVGLLLADARAKTAMLEHLANALIERHEYVQCAHCDTLIDYDGTKACTDRECWGCGAIGSENEHECEGVPDHCPGCHETAAKVKDDEIAEFLDHVAETTGEVPTDWRTRA